MYTYCILNDKSKVLGLGTREEAVMQAFNWYIDDQRKLHARVEWFSDYIAHSFTGKYSDSEIAAESLSILIRKASEWRLTVYKSVKHKT